MLKSDNVILFDMDNTLVDWDTAILRDLNALRCHKEEKVTIIPKNGIKKHFRARMDRIMMSIDWWANLDTVQLGMDLWTLAGELGFERVICTQGPRRNPYAWTGKKLWVDKVLGQDVKVIITRDKSLVKGAILVDDWPLYVIPWLEENPKSAVILPKHHHNITFKHKRATIYSGKNIQDIRNIMLSFTH